jgi:hypothetical protein
MSRLTDMGDWLRSALEFPPELMEQITSGTDEQMALVADVHTHMEGDAVLHEAVGAPNLICVLLPRIDAEATEGQLAIFWGAVFDCYEFKQPLEERLTDEAWQEMDPKPPRPAWTDAFIVE